MSDTASPPAAETDLRFLRREDINAKQAILAKLLGALNCEAVLLLMPAHIAWFTGGMNIRGLIADGERPGIYTNGKNRWLICGNVDTPRLFEEELNGLGFMVKEWQWSVGRANLLGDLVNGKKVACDRPFPNMPPINDKLRPELRALFPSDRLVYRGLGRDVAHALEATARNLMPGQTEREAAGQLAHRVYHRGAEVASMSVLADDRARHFRRAGFTDAKIERQATLQVTAVREGLHITASRTVAFAALADAEREEWKAAVRVAAIVRSLSVPGESIARIVDATGAIVNGTNLEHEWRLSQPGYGAGWFAADELRKAGQDEKFVLHQPIVWQTRFGAMASVDTVFVGEQGAEPMTGVENWPFKRVRLNGQDHDIPDVLVRTAG
jgi:hypothetical protein